MTNDVYGSPRPTRCSEGRGTRSEAALGTWGPGNFDDDGALDAVGRIADDIADVVDSSLQRPIDSISLQANMAKIAVLLALADHCHANVDPRVAAWRDIVLHAYDRMRAGRDDELALERRRVIVETFDRLLAHRTRRNA